MQFFYLFLTIFSFSAFDVVADASSNKNRRKILAPVKLDSARDTMRSFMDSMNAYRQAYEKKDSKEASYFLQKAVRTLDLSGTAIVLQNEVGGETAKLLKEVIDRVILIDYEKIPPEEDRIRWRLKDTEITIIRLTAGEHSGEHLFSATTVSRAKEFYLKVKHLPYLRGSGQGAKYSEPWVQNNVPDWAKKKYLFFTNWQWIGLFLAILFGSVIKVVAQHLLRMVQAITKRTRLSWDYKIAMAFEGPFGLLLASLFWLLCIHLLQFEGIGLVVLKVIVQIFFSISLIWAAYRMVDVFTEYLRELTKRTDTILDDNLLPLIHRSLRVFAIVFGVLLLFQNLGVNVMSVLAGLGLGGLAFALAAKDTCANLFGSIMIAIDHPFKIGDWVKIGEDEGIVEDIGFRSTRIRTFYNSVISLPNASVANSNIDNYGRRDYRRIVAYFGLTYDTPADKLQQFIDGVKKIVEENEFTRKDYYHVVFNAYRDSSLEVMLYCFLKVPDWGKELKERENIYFQALQLAKEIGVDFAFPTQSLHLESMPKVQFPNISV